MNRTLEVLGLDRGTEPQIDEAERLETKMEEMGSRRGYPKNVNLISPLQIIRQGCISFDSGGAPIQNFSDEPFDDIMQQDLPTHEERMVHIK